MIKNIGKFKQWTGEKMGKNQKTRMDEDFHSMTTETDAKRIALEKLNEASQAYLKAISKRVEGDDKHKGLAIETFGMSMSAQSYTLREGTPYRLALQRMGDVHQNMATAQSELISRFGSSYLECLERNQAQMKEYQALQKKLQSRRLDYDAKLAKVQKAKKEKPEWEEEMQAAKAKYEETRENVITIMNEINEAQDDNVNSLRAYYDAQLVHARKIVEILEGVPADTFAFTSPNGSRASLYAGNGGGTRRISRQNSHDPDEERSNHSDDQTSIHSTSNGRHPLDRAPSSADLRRHNTSSHFNAELSRSMSHLTPNAAQTRKNSAGGTKSNGLSIPPPVPPSRARAQKQVRALYTFEATGDGELSIQKGDVIRIIEEIDEGWWEGELVDAHGHRQTGMFPSNYCEEIMSDAGSTRQGSMNSNSSDPGRYADEDEAAYYERESEPTVQYEEPEQEEVIQAPVRRAPPPPTRQAFVATTPHTNGMNGHGAAHGNGSSTLTTPPVALARATPPQSRPASTMAPLARTPTLGTRMPPPPPPTRRAAVETMRHSTVLAHPTPVASPPGHGPSPPATSVPVTPSASMMGYIPKDYFSSQAAGPSEAEMGPCRECQCTEFSANVFKRGSCNNCFHIH